MTVLSIRSRSWAALAVLGLVAALTPVAAAPASAVPSYDLTTPGMLRTGDTGTFVLTASEAMPAGHYCIAIDDDVAGLTSAAVSREAGLGTTQLVFSVEVSPGAGADATFSAYPVESAGDCDATTPLAATILASAPMYVSGAPTALTLSPGSQSVPVDQPATVGWDVTDSNDEGTYLVAGEALYLTSNRATVTFNGAVLTELTIPGPALPGSFTVRNSQAEAATVSGSVSTPSGPDPSDQVTVTTTSLLSMALSPTSATTNIGGSTTFTVTMTGAGGIVIPGVAVSAAVLGRNPRATAVVGTTNQSGVVTWTLTDTNTSSSLTQDTVTFTGGGATRTAVVTYAPAATVAVSPTSATTTPGGSTTFTITVTGTGSTALPGVQVSAAVSGRNPRTSSVVGSTNQAGVLTWTLTDQNPTSTVAQDTVTFSAAGGSKTATVTYSSVGSIVVAPAAATTLLGGTTTLTVTVKDTAGKALAGIPVTVASTGRNVLTAQSAGTTNANGQVTWAQKDTAPASSTANTDTVTFTAGGKSAQSVITYVPPASVTVTSPSNGSAISSGGYFGVSAQSTGVAAGTTAYLTLNGRAKASSTVQPNGFIRFDNTALGGGQWIPAEAGNYGVRICGGACGPTIATSGTFSLTIIPFQIVGQPTASSSRLLFTVATGNWSPGTRIYLTRNGFATASARVVRTGERLTIAAGNRAGTYQVRVNSNQGYVYGNHDGVVTIR